MIDLLLTFIIMIGLGYWGFFLLRKVKKAKKIYSSLNEDDKKLFRQDSSGIGAYGAPIPASLWIFLISVFGLILFGTLLKKGIL